MSVRVRIAPSPTGHLHVGTARTAVYNWLLAHHHGGTFILRMEDTDRARSSDEMVDAIQTSLKWLGLDWDEGPIFQSQRGSLYTKHALELEESGKAYRCYCTPEELQTERDEAMATTGKVRYSGRCRSLSPEQRHAHEAAGRTHTLRIRIDDDATSRFHDLVGGDFERQNIDLDDWIIARADRTVTYNFACAVDDHDMGITHVIRGNDHITNTFKQLFVYSAFGWDPPEFAHLPLILGRDKRKISKREGAVAVDEFGREGFLPEALLNFLALLGWSPGDDREVMTIDEMVRDFSLDRVNASNPVFDREKLEWLNGEHIRAADPNRILKLLHPLLNDAGLATPLWIESRWQWMLKWLDMLKPRARVLGDFIERGAPYFHDPKDYDEKGVKKHFQAENAKRRLTELASAFEAIPEHQFNMETTEAALRELADKHEEKAAQYIHPLRLALTGTTAGPGLFEITDLLGRETCLRRLQTAIAYVERVVC